jgi:hypothetical protein
MEQGAQRGRPEKRLGKDSPASALSKMNRMVPTYCQGRPASQYSECPFGAHILQDFESKSLKKFYQSNSDHFLLLLMTTNAIEIPAMTTIAMPA